LDHVTAIDAQGTATIVYTPQADRVLTHDCTTLNELVESRLVHLEQAHLLSARTDQLTLRFVTPARIRIKGQAVETPNFVELVRSISLRLSMLMQTFGDGAVAYDYRSMLEMAQCISVKESTLRLVALDRYSNRRQGKLQLDGFIGDITFSGEALSEFLPLLVAGEFLHVGSGTAFGLGRYSVTTPFNNEGSNARSVA
jgi:CRISPR/Cas system endoribonuclease Cas6 (RAMP superfamily)